MRTRSALLRLGIFVFASVLSPLARAQDAPPERIRFGDPLELAYDEPYFPGARYDASIPTPDAVLGQQHGSRLSHHAEVLEIFRRLAAASPRVTVERYGATHEGRELVYAVITSERNHARLASIRGNLARLSDPRGLSDGDAERLLEGVVPVAWMAYSIHGDELSGTDAAVALGYHLAADTSEETQQMLERVVVVVDPCQNPDGRERILSMVEQSAGYTPNLDYASMQRGRWPWGRGNHYLFDMNRDWMAGTQPETRGRWRAVRSFHPQLFVDAHEMGSLDTYLFYPQAEPLNPALDARLTEWQGVFAAGVAREFDARGWSYYTREWADGWAPFYSDSWGSLVGAIGVLYEQARTLGFPLRRAAGEILTYRESVHHQAVASLSNVRTLAAKGDELVASWFEQRRRNVAKDTPGNDRVLVVLPDQNPSRLRSFLATLLAQGIEVERTKADTTGQDAEGSLGQRAESAPGIPRSLAVELREGSYVVAARQPERALVRAFLDFDPRMDRESLLREREELERKDRSKVYDVTGWSLPHAYGLDAWWTDELDVELERVSQAPDAPSGIVAESANGAPAAWLVDGADDASVAFAARAMELGVALALADDAFSAAGRTFPRGSLLVRRAENPGELDALVAKLERAAQEAGVRVYAAASGRSPDAGPDLGGGHFHLLARPRVALLSNSPIETDLYGHLWHQLDRVLGVPVSAIDAAELSSVDLRRYNVLVLPPGGGMRALLAPVKDALAAWIEAGGTLVACGSSAAALTRDALGLSSVVLRRNVLSELGAYRVAAKRQWDAREIELDEALVWDGPAPQAEGGEEAQAPDEGAKSKAEAKGEPEEKPESLDAWRRRFSPFGASLLAYCDPNAWITAGSPEKLPVAFSGDAVFLSTDPVAVRLGRSAELRLGGLLWPEARERIAESAYLTVERKGAGQIVLFASMPAFRGYHYATARLFSNAVVYGPGVGADQPVGW